MRALADCVNILIRCILRRAFSLQAVGFIFMAADAKSNGCRGGGSLLARQKLTEAKLAAGFAPSSVWPR